jgi:signal transduction histidine kinase
LSTYHDRELTERFVTPKLDDVPERRQPADVLSVIAHDLRDPLAVIAMSARAVEGLADGRTHVDAVKVREAMRTIRETAAWMEDMIQDLLDMATIDAGRLSLDRRPADLVVLLMRAVELFEPLADERSIHLTTDVPDDLPHVPVDSRRVLRVIANLLSNAIKFTEPGGEVIVRAYATSIDVVLSVVDTGSGVPPEHVAHIFDRFWRGRHTTGIRGSGLGLAIAKAIVEAHGGRIWVESGGLGKGSTFSVAWPVIERPAPGVPSYTPIRGRGADRELTGRADTLVPMHDGQ